MTNDRSEAEPGLKTEQVPISGRYQWGAMVVLGALILASYWSSLPYDFVLDDVPCISGNLGIGEFCPIWNVADISEPTGLRRRPVASWTFTANYLISGLAPEAFRLTNVCIHFCAALFVFLCVKEILCLPAVPDRYRPMAPTVAVCSAYLWALHPVQTESVTYVVQRIEAMFGLLFLGMTYTFVRGMQSSRPWVWYGASIVFCALGMGTKEVMITAPAVVLLLDFVFSENRIPQILRRRWPVYLGYGLCSMWLIWITFFTKIQRPIGTFTMRSVPRPTRLEYFGTQPEVLLQYFYVLLDPSQLCFDRYWPIAKGFGAIAPAATVVGLLVGVSAYCVFRYRSKIAWAILSYFIILSPTSTIIPLWVYFEHRVYLPYAFLCAIASLGLLLGMRRILGALTSDSGRAQAATMCIVGFVSLLLCAGTMMRNVAYKDYRTLMMDTLRRNPTNVRALMNLSGIFLDEGRHVESAALLERAVEIEPTMRTYQGQLAWVYVQSGRADLAIEHLKSIEPMFPDDDLIQNRFAYAYEMLGDWNQAEKFYRNSIDLAPYRMDHRVNFAAGLSHQNRDQEALEQIEFVLEHQPENLEALLNMGVLMHKKGEIDRALVYLEKVVGRDPSNSLANKILDDIQASRD